jgi:poly-beta-1,6-N-acetyl-D-glucosamine N-deacetylase
MNRVLRFVFAWLFANTLIWLGFVRRAKAATFRGEHILSIYFHKPSRAEFEACVTWLKKNCFNFLSTDDLYQIINNKLPFPKGAVVLTVDDGWQSNKSNIVDVAVKHQIPVTIFVATEPVEHGVYWWSVINEAHKKGMTPMRVDQLKKVPNQKRLSFVNNLSRKLILKREALTVKQVQQIAASPWITIGAHTSSHPILNNCSEEQVYFEAQESREKLQNWTGRSVNYFAYPNGDYSEREVKIISEVGYKLAFSVRTEYLTENIMHQKYELPRFEVIEDAPFAETICRMTGVWEPSIARARKIFKNNASKKKPSTPASLNNPKFAKV